MKKRKKAPAADALPSREPPAAQGGKKTRRVFRGLVCGAALILFCGAVCLGAAMFHSWTEPGAAREMRAEDFEVEGAGRERVVAGESSDLTFLRNRAGCPLPYFEGQMFMGEIRNAEYDGKNACVVTMTYQSGLVITAAAPREAAPLLLRKDMEVLMRGDGEISLAGNVKLRALMCQGKSGSCLYFETDSAAYSVYAPGTDAERLYAYLTETRLNVR